MHGIVFTSFHHLFFASIFDFNRPMSIPRSMHSFPIYYLNVDFLFGIFFFIEMAPFLQSSFLLLLPLLMSLWPRWMNHITWFWKYHPITPINTHEKALNGSKNFQNNPIALKLVHKNHMTRLPRKIKGSKTCSFVSYEMCIQHVSHNFVFCG